MNESEKQEFITDLRESLKLEAEVAETWHDAINPKHYQKNGMESIDVINAFVPDGYSFYMGNVIKYVLRHMDKNQCQDLEKARWYLDKMIEDWND